MTNIDRRRETRWTTSPELRQVGRPGRTLPVGRRIVVIGGGMTAIDIAVPSRRKPGRRGLVSTIVYRRGPEQMGASRQFEQDVCPGERMAWRIKHMVATPSPLLGDGHVEAVEFEYTVIDSGGGLASSGHWRSAIGLMRTWCSRPSGSASAGTCSVDRGRGDGATSGRGKHRGRRRPAHRRWTASGPGGDCVYGRRRPDGQRRYRTWQARSNCYP